MVCGKREKEGERGGKKGKWEEKREREEKKRKGLVRNYDRIRGRGARK